MRYLIPVEISTNFNEDSPASFIVGDNQTLHNRWPNLTKAEQCEWMRVNGDSWDLEEIIECQQYTNPTLYARTSVVDLLESVQWKLHVKEHLIDTKFSVTASLELIGHSENILMVKMCLP